MDIAVISIYYGVLLVLAIYGLHRLHLVRLLRRNSTLSVTPEIESWPAVTVQLPVFNEPLVVERLLEAAASLRYPGRLEIQLLDDSTDSTSDIAAAKIRQLVASGRSVRHLKRQERTGFKAGALAAGMNDSCGELFAIFDSDFVPQPDFLVRVVPFFTNRRVGMVQARWTHLNRTASMLTSIQAVYLDAHFAVESAARNAGGRFFNFNGTAGMWRREAIEEAGGWSSSTLTEDLDLSYRAQLAGWEFVFLPEVEVPAELPDSLSGFHDQQHRWAKGSLQTARKLLPAIMKRPLAAKVKIEAFFHLTSNIAYLLTLLLALFIVPSLLIRQRNGLQWLIAFDLLLFASSTIPIFIFYFEGQRRVSWKRPGWLTSYGLLVIGVGMSIRNASAAIEGLFQHGGFFSRTPKQGDAARARLERPPRLPVGETILFVYFGATIWSFVLTGQWLALPFVILFFSGYGCASLGGLWEWWRFDRSASAKLIFENELPFHLRGVGIAK